MVCNSFSLRLGVFKLFRFLNIFILLRATPIGDFRLFALENTVLKILTPKYNTIFHWTLWAWIRIFMKIIFKMAALEAILFFKNSIFLFFTLYFHRCVSQGHSRCFSSIIQSFDLRKSPFEIFFRQVSLLRALSLLGENFIFDKYVDRPSSFFVFLFFCLFVCTIQVAFLIRSSSNSHSRFHDLLSGSLLIFIKIGFKMADLAAILFPKKY